MIGENMESSRVLVTGGAGFIGSSLVEQLLQNGNKVVVIDNLSRGKLDNLSEVSDYSVEGGSLRILVGDCCDPELLEQAYSEFGGFDSIHHLAAINGTKWFDEIPTEIIELSIDSTRILIDYARLCDSKFVFYSSPEAYGENPNQPLGVHSSSVFSNPQMHQRHSYGASKYLCEVLVQSACKSGLRAAIVRPFNVYGERLPGGEYGQVVSIFLHLIKNKKDLTVHGNGGQSRSFTYIDDIVSGLISIEKANPAIGFAKAYNLGSSSEITILELAELCIDVTGSGKSTRIIHGDGYNGDSASRLAELGEFEREIDWNAGTSLRDGLAKVWSSISEI